MREVVFKELKSCIGKFIYFSTRKHRKLLFSLHFLPQFAECVFLNFSSLELVVFKIFLRLNATQTILGWNSLLPSVQLISSPRITEFSSKPQVESFLLTKRILKDDTLNRRQSWKVLKFLGG